MIKSTYTLDVETVQALEGFVRVSPRTALDTAVRCLHHASAHEMAEDAMPTLYVRDVPDRLYEQLRRRAAAERRSVSQETVQLLRLALHTAAARPDPRFASWLRTVTRQRSRLASAGRTFPNSAALI